jgi:hypothetical protein
VSAMLLFPWLTCRHRRRWATHGSQDHIPKSGEAMCGFQAIGALPYMLWPSGSACLSPPLLGGALKAPPSSSEICQPLESNVEP